jgi:hypothetical protein
VVVGPLTNGDSVVPTDVTTSTCKAVIARRFDGPQYVKILAPCNRPGPHDIHEYRPFPGLPVVVAWKDEA